MDIVRCELIWKNMCCYNVMWVAMVICESLWWDVGGYVGIKDYSTQDVHGLA